MMKRNLFQRLSASLLSAMLLLSASLPGRAAEGDGETYPGPQQTVSVSSDITGRETNFNSGWKFYLGDNSAASGASFDDSAWNDVTLPHDFSISQNFTTSGEAESGFLPGGTGWYRKTFTLSASEEGKTVILGFDGVYSDAYVYVNGNYVGEHHYGYTAFAFDITDFLTYDGAAENVIAVKTVNNLPSSRWYSGSGIYRDVTLTVTDPVHVAYGGTYVTTPNIADGDGTVQVQVTVDNDSDKSAEVTVKNTVYTSDGTAASAAAETTASVAANSSTAVTTNAVVDNPALWSTETPNLYSVHTQVYVGDTLTDSYETQFGFRWFTFQSETGFYLNGEALKLNGVCMHHDQGAAGSAAYDDAMYRQLASMKEMGANAIRTSHNPADEDFIDICNQLGLLVIEEAFDGWSLAKNGNSNDFSSYFTKNLGSDNGLLYGESDMSWAQYAIQSMVRRDRNDPSVILWSLGNEITEGTSGDSYASEYPTIAQNLIDWMKEVDTSRPATLGDNRRPSNTSSVLGQVLEVIQKNGGVVGFNYASGSALSSLHNTWGTIYSAETSSAVNSRGIYCSQANRADADGKLHLTSYDTSAVSWGMPAHDSMWNTLTSDYIAGEFVWTGWDYIGEPTPWNGTGSGSVSGQGAIPNSSYFGIVDTAGFEKDSYYLYRSQWKQDSTTLHLVTAWDSDNLYTDSNGQTPVVIYSNAPTVKLYRNGTHIGTATRTAHTTDAGHTYYTYTAESMDSTVCTAASATNADSLYATFAVTYEAGTISAVAYDESGEKISATAGTKSVSTPDAPNQLKITQNVTAMDADGQSLSYIQVEVLDANGNLDTTATNTIQFSLRGEGEILGVDNGDQATTDKYQQSSVLTSSTSAQIAAYAGKALVIVRSTDTAGTIDVDISSNGLTGGSASITTNAADNGDTAQGLVSYTLVRDYSVLAGTAPTLQTSASGTLADGTTLTGSIVWETIPAETYGTAGDYTIAGTLTFSGYDPISVTARLHVIDHVIAMRNCSAVTAEHTVPTLPSTANGVLADGTVTGEFSVDWEPVSESDFAAVGDIVTVKGTAVVIGDVTLPITCTVRVAEAVNTESTNAAITAAVTQDIDTAYQSDNLNAVNDGDTTYQDDTNTRWTNYNNRTRSDTATLTFTWATAESLSGANLYYYVDGFSASLPSAVEFRYSLNGSDFTTISYTSETTETNTYGQTIAYTFDQAINPIAVQVVLTQQGGTSGGKCVGLIEAELMRYAGAVTENSSAALSGIAVDGTAIPDFSADVLSYQASGTTVTAATEVNAGITILPADDSGIVRILTVSEDGSESKTYQVALTSGCAHANVTTVGAKDATCTEDGYTGDRICDNCQETVEVGTVIPATGHSWDGGTVTTEPTETTAGVRTYTCTVCGETKTEGIPALGEETEPPTVSLSLSQNDGKVRMTGRMTNLAQVTDHGFVYITKARLGSKTLTVNTTGRTKVSINGNDADGSYRYSMTPRSESTTYVFRAYVTYANDAGKTVYVYSNPIYTSYDQLQ